MILAKLGGYKVSHVKGEKNGNPYDFYSLERSYKDKNENWKTESIIIRPAEMAVVSELLNTACAKVIAQQTSDTNARREPTGDAFVSDDVPF